jgi:ubiquinol-cytochrome c reductase cytochrome b/c1 subunit
VLAKSGKAVASVAVMLAVAGALFAGSAQSARAEEQSVPPSQKWSFAGPFGKFDRGSLQRGLKVYKEVCSSCHGLSYIAFRNLADAGGPGYSTAQAAALAADYKIKDGPNDQGDMFDRPGRPPITSPRHSPTIRPRAPPMAAVCRRICR